MKYLKKFENENGYQSFCNGEQYIEPHVVLISDTWDIRFKNTTQSPLVGGITLREDVLDGDDTTTLGITVYNYLKGKCGNGTNGASYTLLSNENLYCTYDSAPQPFVINEQTEKITYCSYEEINTPGGVINDIRLYNENSTPTEDGSYSYFTLDEGGTMSRMSGRDTVSEMP